MEDRKAQTQVLIAGRIYSLSGADPAWLQRVAGYLNSKIAECRTSQAWRGLDADYRALLLNINLADDYFRSEQEKEEAQKRAAELDQELYAARHDLVSTKLKLENSLRQQELLEKRLQETEAGIRGGNGQ